MREDTGRGRLAISSGRYQIRTITFDFNDTGFFKVQVTPKGRDAGTTEMTGYILGEATSLIDAPPIISGNLPPKRHRDPALQFSQFLLMSPTILLQQAAGQAMPHVAVRNPVDISCCH